jgi:tripartite ATP-independent transporter DctM subunit
MHDTTTGILGLIFLLLLFAGGMELAYAMGIVGFIGFALITSWKAAMNMMAKDFFSVFCSYSFTVVPLFVLMGSIAYNSGIASRLYTFTHRLIGHVSGGLGLATVVGVTIFKAICGSSVATTATFAAVAIPEMDRFNYAKKFSTGIVAVAGSLGILLPPSVTLIIFAMITELPIGKLFMAGLIPGLVLAALFVAVIICWGKINPEIGPKSQKFSWKERAEALPAVLTPIIIFLILIGGLMAGFFTPTEAGSVGALAVLLFALLLKMIGKSGIILAIKDALKTSCMMIMLIASSNILSHFVAVTGIPEITVNWLTGLPVHKHIVMVLIFLVFLIGGSVIDDMAFMILATPIFFPAILELGYDPLWAGIIICLTVVVGGVIPPVAINVFVVKNITKVPINIIYSGVYPFLISLAFLLVLLFIFPQICLYLPANY